MRFHNLLYILWFYFGVKCGFTIIRNNFYQWNLVTHSHATHMFQVHTQVVFHGHFFHFLSDFFAAAGHTARAQPDADFTFDFGAIGFAVFLSVGFSLLTFEIGYYGIHLVGSHVAVSNSIYLHNRCQCTATEATHFLKRVFTGFVGVFVFLYF